MTNPPVTTEADIAYVREHFVELGELSARHGADPAAVRTAIAEARLPAPAYVLADGAEMVPEDYFALADEAGGLDLIRETFLERYAVAAEREAVELARGEQEWEAYLSGLYGVCLKRVTPESIVRKSALVAVLDDLLARPDPEDAVWAATVRERVAELDDLERPFAPTYDRLRFGGPSSRDRLITETRERYPELFAVGAVR